MTTESMFPQTGTAVVRVGAENYGVIENKSKRGLWTLNEKVWNDHFFEYRDESLLNVLVRVTDTGERFIDKITLKEGSFVTGTIVDLEHDTELRTVDMDSEEEKSRRLERIWRERRGETKPDEFMPSPAFGVHSVTIGAAVGADDDIVLASDFVFTPKIKIEPKTRHTFLEQEPPALPTHPILDGYYISPEARLNFNTALRMSQAEPAKAVKIMMVGPSGYGKTTIPELFAAVTEKRFYRMNCASIRDPEEWFGFREARDGSTVFIRSEFIRQMEEGNVVMVLDEFNRLEPWLHNTLFPLLDHAGKTVVHDEEFRIGEGVVVVGTINTGYKYTGIFELDEALLNRFDLLLEVGPMPHNEEVSILQKRTGVIALQAERIVKTSNVLRQQNVVCSTSTALRIARMVSHGMTEREAFEMAVIRRIPQDGSGSGLRKQVIDAVNVQLGGGFKTRKLVNDIFSGATTVEEEQGGLEGETPSHRITLTRNPSVAFLNIKALKALRAMEVLVDDEYVTLSLSEAKTIVDRIEKGETLVLEIITDITVNAFGRLDEFESCGIHAVLEVN